LVVQVMVLVLVAISTCVVGTVQANYIFFAPENASGFCLRSFCGSSANK
jgi:hypothetical protein